MATIVVTIQFRLVDNADDPLSKSSSLSRSEIKTSKLIKLLHLRNPKEPLYSGPYKNCYGQVNSKYLMILLKHAIHIGKLYLV